MLKIISNPDSENKIYKIVETPIEESEEEKRARIFKKLLELENLDENTDHEILE